MSEFFSSLDPDFVQLVISTACIVVGLVMVSVFNFGPAGGIKGLGSIMEIMGVAIIVVGGYLMYPIVHDDNREFQRLAEKMSAETPAFVCQPATGVKLTPNPSSPEEFTIIWDMPERAIVLWWIVNFQSEDGTILSSVPLSGETVEYKFDRTAAGEASRAVLFYGTVLGPSKEVVVEIPPPTT